MKTIKFLLVALCLLLGAGAAGAQSVPAAYKAKVVEIIEDGDMRSQFKDMLYAQYKQLGLGKTLSDEKLMAMSADIARDVWPIMEDIFAKTYYKYFTMEDLDNLSRFYSTPTGKKSLKYMSQVMTDVQEQLKQTPEFVQIVQKVVTRYM